MPRTPKTLLSRGLSGGALVLAATLAGCATGPTAAKLPFHVAILPPVAVPDTTLLQKEGNPTELGFVVDEPQLLQQLETALKATFLQVSLLSPAAAGSAGSGPSEAGQTAAAAQLQQAQATGADLILQTTLRYQPAIRTSLNDRFWLNLPLFALGGPFGWFVSDRSYHCNTRLDGQLFDVGVAGTSPDRDLTNACRVLRVDRGTTEASLNFLDRADGPGAYVLSLVCPAGLLAARSDAVPAELDTTVVTQLCQALAESMQDRATEITESDLVDFHPRGVRVSDEGGQRFLTGDMVLGLSQANELGSLRYRFGNGPFVDAAWQSDAVVDAGGGGRARKVYTFKIPLAGASSDRVQVEVEQLDRFSTRRTFTFPTR